MPEQRLFHIHVEVVRVRRGDCEEPRPVHLVLLPEFRKPRDGHSEVDVQLVCLDPARRLEDVGGDFHDDPVDVMGLMPAVVTVPLQDSPSTAREFGEVIGTGAG